MVVKDKRIVVVIRVFFIYVYWVYMGKSGGREIFFVIKIFRKRVEIVMGKVWNIVKIMFFENKMNSLSYCGGIVNLSLF